MSITFCKGKINFKNVLFEKIFQDKSIATDERKCFISIMVNRFSMLIKINIHFPKLRIYRSKQIKVGIFKV